MRRAGTGALVDNTQPGTRMEQVIESVLPGTVSRGDTHSIRFELKPENARRRLPVEKPSWVQIGPFEASKIERNGNVVTADFRIPSDATVGVLLDCHIEFGNGAHPIAIKKNDVLRVIESKD